MRHLVQGGPQAFPELAPAPKSRWTLATLRDALLWVQHYSLSGIWRLLRGLEINWKRGREHVHSPDPQYLAKVAAIEHLREQVQLAPLTTAPEQGPLAPLPMACGQDVLAPAAQQRLVLLFQDEMTYYRQPTLAHGYAAAGTARPLAERSLHSNTATRLCGALNARTGQVTAQQASHFGVAQLVHFYQLLCQTYGPGERLYLVQDNWPIHFHPDLLIALEDQQFLPRWPRRLPPTWSTRASPSAVRKWGGLHLPIQLVPLPTYASWCNPIEKLWRKLRQDHLHLHPLADDLATLRQQVLIFLAQFAAGSNDLLRYVGLKRSG